MDIHKKEDVSTIRILGLQDEKFLYDVNEFKETIQDDKREITESSYSPYNLSYISAFCMKWPYLTCSGLDSNILIVNIFNRFEI